MDPVSVTGRIDVISDVICPWCYIGKRQLERALDILEKDRLHFAVAWHPFQLNPQMPDPVQRQVLADDAEAREPRVVGHPPVAAPAVEAAERRLRLTAEDAEQGQHTGRTRSDPFVHRALPSRWAAGHRPRTQLYGAAKKGGLPREYDASDRVSRT